MQKKSKIIIDGEYMGNNVLINGMFRTICAISPMIMRYFIGVINNIKELQNAVSITNFNCSSNSININFKNDILSGSVCLLFKMVNNQPELSDYQIVLNNNEYDLNKKIDKESENKGKIVEDVHPEIDDANNISCDIPQRNCDSANSLQNYGEKANSYIFNTPEHLISNPIKKNPPKAQNDNPTKNIKMTITQNTAKTQSPQKIKPQKTQKTSNNIVMQKRMMTLEEYRAVQKRTVEAKEKFNKQKMHIVGSHEHINARALINGVFVAGNKVYKWGDTKVLEK